jgi:hypothetical protein
MFAMLTTQGLQEYKDGQQDNRRQPQVTLVGSQPGRWAGVLSLAAGGWQAKWQALHSKGAAYMPDKRVQHGEDKGCRAGTHVVSLNRLTVRTSSAESCEMSGRGVCTGVQAAAGGGGGG